MTSGGLFDCTIHKWLVLTPVKCFTFKTIGKGGLRSLCRPLSWMSMSTMCSILCPFGIRSWPLGALIMYSPLTWSPARTFQCHKFYFVSKRLVEQNRMVSVPENRLKHGPFTVLWTHKNSWTIILLIVFWKTKQRVGARIVFRNCLSFSQTSFLKTVKCVTLACDAVRSHENEDLHNPSDLWWPTLPTFSSSIYVNDHAVIIGWQREKVVWYGTLIAVG